MRGTLESLSFAKSDEQSKLWRKSAEEVAKFILDHLESPGFLDFVRGDDVDKRAAGRWQDRLEELYAKAIKRSGHRLEYNDLIAAAREQILKKREAGELEDREVYEKFCELSEEEYQLADRV
ncbi:MAG: hypothetical protein ACM3PZ_01675 [Bacillota bacterium]